MDCSTLQVNNSRVRVAKTGSERSRAYRLRKKMLAQAKQSYMNEILHSIVSDMAGEKQQTGAERNRAYRLRKEVLSQANQSSMNEILNISSTSVIAAEKQQRVRVAKTGTERSRACRLRKKMLTQANQSYMNENLHSLVSDMAGEKQQRVRVKKTGAERNRAYRLRKKMLAQANQSSMNEMLNISSTSVIAAEKQQGVRVAKTAAERTRACRLRKKMLAQANQSSMNEMLHSSTSVMVAEKQQRVRVRKTGAERTRACRLRKKMLAQANQSSMNEISHSSSTSDIRIMTSGPLPQPIATSTNLNHLDITMVPSSIADHVVDNLHDSSLSTVTQNNRNSITVQAKAHIANFPLLYNRLTTSINIPLTDMEGSRRSQAQQKKNRRFTWTQALENTIIQVWKDNISDLREEKYNGHVYKKMSNDIEETTGTVVTVKEITTKIKNLTKKYENEKRKIESTGGLPSSWYIYDKVHAILGWSPSQNIMVEEFIKIEPEDIDSVDIFPSMSSVIGSENLGAAPLPELSDASLDSSLDKSVDVKDLRPRNRAKKRNYQELLLEEFKRANTLAKEANDIQIIANNLLEKSIKIREEILKKLN